MHLQQDPQTIFGGKEVTRFATDHDISMTLSSTSFDEKIPTLKSDKQKFVDWFVCFRTATVEMFCPYHEG